MTNPDKVMNLQHFGIDPADIRMQINPAVQIQIPDHFWLKCWHWHRFALWSCFLSTSAVSRA